MKIVVVCSHKGGVGKSTVSLGLVRHFSRHLRVCLIDSDLVGSGLDIPLRSKRDPSMKYLADFLLSEPDTIRNLRSLEGHLCPLLGGDAGKVMGMLSWDARTGVHPSTTIRVQPHGKDGDTYVLPRHRIISMLNGTTGMIAWKMKRLYELLMKDDYECCITDCSPGVGGLSDLLLAVLASSPQLAENTSLVIVATPDGTSYGGLPADMDYLLGVSPRGTEILSRSFIVFNRWSCGLPFEGIGPLFEELGIEQERYSPISLLDASTLGYSELLGQEHRWTDVNEQFWKAIEDIGVPQLADKVLGLRSGG